MDSTSLVQGPIVVSLCVLVAVVIIHFLHSRSTGGKYKFPPGPSPLPIIGNLHQFPLEYQHVTFGHWAHQYGDVVTTRLFSTPAIILSSAQAARDLMEKRGAKYSDRPHSVFVYDMLRTSTGTTFLHYGNQWRRHRKWFREGIQTDAAVQRYHPLLLREVQILLLGLCQEPHAFQSHVKRYASALMVEISFGRTVTSLDDELVTLAENTFTAILETGGAATTLVDLFPILRFWPTWLPGLEFKRRASEIAQMLRITMDVPYEGVVKEMAAGVNKPSLLASLIEKLSIEGVVTEEDEEDLKGAITTVYAGGTDTTMTAIMTFILAMVMHPNIFLKAQAEVDQVTKGSRLPEFDDRHSLPYLECVLKEVYRWGCPLPLGVPHRLIEDDEYNGYHLPGGSTIIPNIWAMTRREDIYPDPERFFPERFESMDDETFELYDPRKLIFGFGRRICPGRTFADNSVWIAAASILSALDIRKARDQTGEEISPVPVFKSGFTRHVLPFECDIRPRSRKDV